MTITAAGRICESDRDQSEVDAAAHVSLGVLLHEQGEFKAARAEAGKRRAVDPLSLPILTDIAFELTTLPESGSAGGACGASGAERKVPPGDILDGTPFTKRSGAVKRHLRLSCFAGGLSRNGAPMPPRLSRG